MVSRLYKLTGWLAALYVAPAFAQVTPAGVHESADESHAPAPESVASRSADPPQSPASPAPPAATSDAASEARLAFDEGLRLLRAEQWQQAEASFRRSLARMPRPSTNYNLAFVLFKQDKLQRSAELLQKLLSSDDPALDARYRDYAKVLLANVLAAVSVLHLVVSPEIAEVRVDGQLVAISGPERSLPVDPGTHRVRVSAPGFLSQSAEVVIPARSEAQREIRLSQLAPPVKVLGSAPRADDAPTRSPLATIGPWLTIGVGTALLAAAVVTGVLAKNADAEFTQQCPTLNHCDPQLQRTGNEVKHLATATTVLVAAGTVFVAGGVTWRLLLSSQPARDGQRSVLLAASMRL